MSESLDFVFERANSALITQDFEYAERLLTNVLKKHPDISPKDKEKIENLLARIYGDEGDLERALAAYLRLYERESDSVDLMLNLGRIYRHLERYEDALKILKKAQETGGDTDEVLYSLAKTYKRMRDYDEAAGYFLRAIELKPDHAHAYDRLGNLYLLTGETDKAIDIYKKGLRVDPNHPYLNFHLAGLLRQEKRYEEAVVYYNSALRINPAWGEVLSGIAVAYLQLDKLDDALNTFRSLLRITGESAPLYTELGCLFEKKQLQQEAEQYYYDALAIDSGYAPAVLALTRILEKKQQYSEALPILLAAEIASINADNHILRLKAIQMCMYAKDYAKANELFGRLDAEHSNSLNALKLKGQLYALTGEREQAEDIFKKILKTAPAAIEFRQELAEQYLLARKYKEAREQLKLFLRQKPTDTSALMALGKTEELLNNPHAAYQEYQKVLDLNPDAIEARSALARLFQKRGDTIAALETANEILNMQSGSETGEHEQDMAESLDLYEQAAENYIADPMLTKNLEKLKPDEVPLYISPDELNPKPNSKDIVPSLRDISKLEDELPFEMLIEGTEEVKDLPPEKDDLSLEAMPFHAESQENIFASPISSSYTETSAVSYTDNGENLDPLSYTAATGNTGAGTVVQPQNEPPITASSIAGGEAFMFPIDEPEINSDDAENDAALDVGDISQQSAQTLHKRQDLLRDEAIQERLKAWDTYGTTIGFLQDVISDIDKQMDENRYTQAVEILAEKIAENLSHKIPLQTVIRQEKLQDLPEVQESVNLHELQQSDEAASPDMQGSDDGSIQSEPDVPASIEDSVQVIETQEEAVFGIEQQEKPVSEVGSASEAEVKEESVPDVGETESATEKEPEISPPNPNPENDGKVAAGDDEVFFIDAEEEGESETELEQEQAQEPEQEEEASEQDLVEELEPTQNQEQELEQSQEIEQEEGWAEQDQAQELESEQNQEQEFEQAQEIEQEEPSEQDQTQELEHVQGIEQGQDQELEQNQKQPEHSDSFILDQEQQNLLWCHAKHQLKDSPSFEQYLTTADPDRLAQLFLYLRDLFTYLPQEELELFLNSSERIQIYYIIARLSGELGLKERANLIQQSCAVADTSPSYNDDAVFDLLNYLRDLSISLPDQELGTRLRQELEQLMANMSSVLSDL